MERGAAKEKELEEENRRLAERISTFEKQCASLTLELKAVQNRYQQEVRSRENNENNRFVNKEEANLEVVKGIYTFLLMNILFYIDKLTNLHFDIFRIFKNFLLLRKIYIILNTKNMIKNKTCYTLQFYTWIGYLKVGNAFLHCFLKCVTEKHEK